jgi:predicted AAA+ superfamily ATPase
MEILKNLRRYYSIDVGMRNSLSEKNINSKGRIIENIVYLELLKRQYKVYGISFYDTNSKDKEDNSSTVREIDFVCIKNSKKINMQVTTDLTLENYNYEIGNFKFIKNGYENYLLTLDENIEKFYDEDFKPIGNVKIINLID